jgi:hypothetical protein
MIVPKVNNHADGSSPFLNVKQMLPLPPETPWGNLGLKSMKIVQRIDHINKKIEHVYLSFQTMHRQQGVPYDVSSLEMEELIYWIRKTVDEFIQLLYVAEHFYRNGVYPKRIKIHSIGVLLEDPQSRLYRMFDGHHPKLQQLNEVGNAYKHSFICSDLNFVGRDEPVVFTLSAGWNDLAKPVQFTSIRLADFVRHFDELYQFTRQQCLTLFGLNRSATPPESLN